MRIEERREMAEGVISYLKNEGYIRLSGKINNRTGECQVLMRRGSDDQIWVNIRDQPLSPVEEFCNECSEVHALAMGLIHSITQRSPTPYSEIDNLDISPELKEDMKAEYHYYLGGFYGLRAAIIIGVVVYVSMEVGLAILAKMMFL